MNALERHEGSQPNLSLVVFLSRRSQRVGRFGKVEVGEGIRREQSRGDLVVGEEVPEYGEPDGIGIQDRGPWTARCAEDRGTSFAQSRDEGTRVGTSDAGDRGDCKCGADEAR